jgi:hypothetical protein
VSPKIDYSTLWKVLSGQPSLEELQTRLEILPEDQLRAAAIGFIEARTELVEALRSRGIEASEDIIEDLAGDLLRQGSEKFAGHLAGTAPLPSREEWGRLELTSPIAVFASVIESRLSQDIYDLWEMGAYR